MLRSALIGLIFLFAGVAVGAPSTNRIWARNDAAIASVESGAQSVADASWWGFNPDDATETLQTAINSKANKVIVPLMSSAWTLRPITLRSGLELEFQPGVLVLAKSGEFQGSNDSLFRADDMTNIVVRGHGATLRMRKSDYQKPAYAKAEWRMGLSFNGCKDVLVEGLRIESSGGDGIYVASSSKLHWSENVTLRDCVCYDNHRQGLSVISAVNLLVERCSFLGTWGTAPESGIDLEPDVPEECLVNCVIRDCIFADNRGAGILIYLKPLNAKSRPVSIRFERCHVRVGEPGLTREAVANLNPQAGSGIAIGKIGDDGPTGKIEFVDCTSENTGREAVRIYDKSVKAARVSFDRCRWHSTWVGRHLDYTGPRAPLLLRSEARTFCDIVGGIDFNDCYMFDRLDGPTVRFEDADGTATLADVTGTIHAPDARNPRTRLGPNQTNVTLRLVGAPGSEIEKP